MIPVQMTALEFDLAQHVAAQRNRDGLAAKANAEKFGNAADTLAVHLRGALFELAVAKGTNRYWTGAGTSYRADSDVGSLQVRGTEHDDGCLIVRPTEGHDADPWVLVTGTYPDYVVRGWLRGRDARQERFLRAPNGRPAAYFVSQSELKGLPSRKR